MLISHSHEVEHGHGGHGHKVNNRHMQNLESNKQKLGLPSGNLT
jgi:hypothetical protein